MIRGLTLFAFIVLTTPIPFASPEKTVSADAKKTVVLLHGLGLRAWAMVRLEHGLTRDGYRVINLTYPSRTLPLEELARTWLPAQLRAHGVDTVAGLNFVTHSMGGIVLRLYVRDLAPANIGRVVMIAPPNQGSEVPDHLENFAPFRWFTGINGRRLGTGPNGLPRTLGPWPAAAGELGVIAGDRSFNPLFSAWLPGPDDGKVSVASTHLSGERAHLVLHHSHTWLQWRRVTLTAVREFLRTGTFADD